MSFWNPLTWFRSLKQPLLSEGPSSQAEMRDQGAVVDETAVDDDPRSAPADPSQRTPRTERDGYPRLEPSQYDAFVTAVLQEAAGLEVTGEGSGIRVLVFECYIPDGMLRCFLAEDHTWSRRGDALRRVSVSWSDFVEVLEMRCANGTPLHSGAEYPKIIDCGLVPDGSASDLFRCVMQMTPDAVRTQRRRPVLWCECCCCDCVDH